MTRTLSALLSCVMLWLLSRVVRAVGRAVCQ